MKLECAYEEIGKFDTTSERRLHGYQTRLRTDVKGKVFDKRARDYLVEISKDGGKIVKEVNGYLDSIGWNQSTYTAAQIDDAVNRFTLPDVPNRRWRRNFKSVKANLTRELRSKGRLKMLEYRSKAAILDALPRLDTHAGFSWLVTGKRYKGDYSEEILEQYSLEESQARVKGSFNKPILIGFRTQGKSPYDMQSGDLKGITDVSNYLKTRLVSMIDLYQILAETKFAKPFQNLLSTCSWYMGGKDDWRIHSLISKSRDRYNHWMSLDYSSYDQTIPAWLIREAFDVVRDCFEEDNFDNELFTIVREDFIHKVFVTANGLVESHKGVPSGSMFTQIIDSIVNKMMIGYYMMDKGITKYDTYIMGDDNLIFTFVKLDEDEISSFLLNEFGIIMNPMKVDHGDREQHPVFLSRIWTRWGAYRHPKLLIAKLLFPERRREYLRYEFKPSMVIDSYFQSFRLGMDELFDYSKHQTRVSSEKNNVSAGKWLTGLMRYQYLYANEFHKSGRVSRYYKGVMVVKS